MGGKNPYLEIVEAPLPTQKYKLKFPKQSVEILVDPSQIPYSSTGQAGSILDIALKCGVEIDHSCGGVLACSTCHILVKKGLSTCNEASEAELDQLDNAPATTFQSRLACQCVPNGNEDVEIEIPGWNRNLVREGRH